jgi:hypothetical protein
MKIKSNKYLFDKFQINEILAEIKRMNPSKDLEISVNSVKEAVLQNIEKFPENF